MCFFTYNTELLKIILDTSKYDICKNHRKLVTRTLNTNCDEIVNIVKYYHCKSHSKT